MIPIPRRIATSVLPLALVAALPIAGAVSTSRAASPPSKPAAAPAPAASGVPPERVAARVNGRPISMNAVDLLSAARLYRILEAEYQVRLDAIQQLAFAQLEDEEAKARGIGIDELIRREIVAKVADPSDEELAAVSAFMKDHLPADPAQAKLAVRATVRAQREQIRRDQFRKELWTKAKVDLELDPPRALIPVFPTDPTRGPADAPVVVVEFGDFECTSCGELRGVIGALERKHEGKLRVVFRQMPLSVHEHSREAAQLALCAGDQGAFWKLHDWLFGNPNKVAKDDVLAAAPGLGIDADMLGACFESGAHQDEIDRDLAMTKQMNVKTTPLVLVNGRVLVGDQAISDLPSVVEDEIERAVRR